MNNLQNLHDLNDALSDYFKYSVVFINYHSSSAPYSSVLEIEVFSQECIASIAADTYLVLKEVKEGITVHCIGDEQPCILSYRAILDISKNKEISRMIINYLSKEHNA